MKFQHIKNQNTLIALCWKKNQHWFENEGVNTLVSKNYLELCTHYNCSWTRGSQNAFPFNSHSVLPGWSAIQHLPVISWWGWWYFCRSVLWTLLPRSRYPEREGWHPTAEHQSHPLLTPHPTNTSSPSEALYWSDGQNKMFTNVSQSYGMQWRTLKSAVNRKIIMLTRAFYMHKNYVISRNNA